MEKIEELKKKLHCQKCSVYYGEVYVAWKNVNCQHHTCSSCIKHNHDDNFNCPVCNCSTKITAIPFLEDLLATLKNYESWINKSDDEIAILKQEDHTKCSECETNDAEQDMQLCITCHGLKFEDHEDVKKYALCAPCAIRKHMRKGHQTVDFFPYLSAYNFSSQSSKIESASKELDNARDLMKNTFTNFNSLSINVSENYDVLTSMARRSKNTRSQVEFFETMEKFINESKSIHGEADSDMKNHTAKLENNLIKIKEWYKSRMGNCVDESEIVKLLNE